jgi:heat-inducible transcriptional repressor
MSAKVSKTEFHERDLTEREQMVLQAVVHMYIMTAEAVGSRTVVKKYNLDLSPATIRNVMADLEDKGYLEQVHTSSGRIPTEKGYRYYVNYLLKIQELSQRERERINRDFTEKLKDVDAVLRHTTHLLALVTHQTGLAEAPSDMYTQIQRIELLPLSEKRIAVFIVDSLSRVRSVLVDVERAFRNTQEVESLNRFLNDHLTGCRANMLVTSLEEKLRNFFDEQRRMAERALEVLQHVHPESSSDLFLEGTTHLFEQPEFQDIKSARELVGLFEDREQLLELLRRAVAHYEADRPLVLIGGEGQKGVLGGMSLVASPYRVQGKPVGAIGILGPRRMPYSKLAAVVDYTASVVSRVLTRITSSTP